MKFIELRWKNFLSYGNNWTRLPLNTNKSNIIIGKNGEGKSVFIDAFHFVLTKKPFRKIKLPQVPNTTNKKNCLVELDLKSGKNLFTIRRGLNPNIFEIEKNGTKLDEESRITDFQKTLESICNFDSKNLKHTTIMSSMDYKPFLEMTTPEKRVFLDDLLNIIIFTKISALLKKKLSVVKDGVNDKEKDIERENSNLEIIREMNEKAKINNDDEIVALKNSIKEMYQSVIKQMKKNIQTFVESNKRSIEDEKKERIEEVELFEKNSVIELESTKTQIETNKQKIIELENNVNEYLKELKITEEKYENISNVVESKKDTAQQKKEERDRRTEEISRRNTDCTNGIAVKNKDIKRIEKQLDFLNDNVICSKCNREIDEKFRSREEETLNKQIDDIRVDLDELNKEKREIEEYKEKIKLFNQKIKSLENDIEQLRTKAYNYHSHISKLKSSIQHSNSMIEDKKIGIERLTEKHKNLIENKDTSIQNIKLRYDNKIKSLERKEETERERIKSDAESNFKRYKKITEEKIERLSNVEKGELKDETEVLEKLLEEKNDLTKLQYIQRIHDLAINIASDKVIKTYVISKYIPILNNQVNEYLEILEAPYRLKFDENLDEQIVARGYEKLSYGNFSSGERARCNLAVLFAFLDVAKSKSSMSSNILILDEVADNSMDKDGIYGILSIISRLKAKGYTVFVISHRDEMKNSFDITYTAAKSIFSNLEML